MKRLTLFVWLSLVVLTIQAQRHGCVISSEVERSADSEISPLALLSRDDNKGGTRGDNQLLPMPYAFDPQKTYRMPVILISFSDADFTMPDPLSYYDRMFNEKGYNEGVGVGCLADYFRDQSNGRLNIQFDVYGPFKVTQKAGGHGSSYYGVDVIKDVVKQLYDTDKTDFSVYDWNGNGEVNEVFFVAASYSGNQVSGYIWPNSQDEKLLLPGDIYSTFTSIATELWTDGSVSGFGTIAHEMCHALGLPDIYPLGSATSFSAVDEWDLLDGGNNTNKGWCPPNLMAMEKMYLGWDQPEELTEATTITDMKSVSAGGKSFLIRNSGNPDEYYLLENRQQEGWDYGCPGNGLIIVHVDYLQSSWGNNEVNISDSHYRYDLFHADGKSYLDWDPNNDGRDPNKYTMPDWLRCKFLSTSAYPFGENQSLTNISSPAAVLFTANADGELFMSKAITNIRVASDGTVSFDFMMDPSGIHSIQTDEGHTSLWYDLQGRQLPGEPTKPGLYINSGKLILRQTHR